MLGSGPRPHRAQQQHREDKSGNREHPQEPSKIEEERPRLEETSRGKQLANNDGRTCGNRNWRDGPGKEHGFAARTGVPLGSNPTEDDRQVVDREQKGRNAPSLAGLKVGSSYQVRYESEEDHAQASSQ